MSIWNDPDISFEDFALYLLDDKNKSSLKSIWETATKNKTLLSELESHELSNILVSFMKSCISSKNKSSKPSSEQLQDASHLFSDWILENKLSGIPSSDDEDYNKMRLNEDIFNKKLLFNWISEASIPLKTYIDSKNQHDPSLSQQEIQSKNKRVLQQHPSLAHLFHQKIVNKKQIKFNDYDETQKQQQQEKLNKKHEAAKENIHTIRQSRAMLFFNHSDIGYEIKRKCKIYKDEKLTQFLIEVDKGELVGGKKENIKNKTIQLLEPIKGYVASKYVKSFDLNSSQWKFLQHQRSQTSVGNYSQSLTLRIKNEDLFLPNEDIEDEEDNKNNPNQDENDEERRNNSNKKRKVKFTGAYNENEDEKKHEDNPTSYNDPKNSLKESFKEKRIRKCKENVSTILNIKKSKRTPQQVLDLWTAGFNLHDISILKKCYSPQVTSQQFVNQELSARDPILQCFKQMFEASDDVGLEVTNCILKDGSVILEFRTFGSRKGDSRGSPTNSTNNGNNNNNNKDSNNDHLLASHPTKSGLPQKVINGVGVFHVNNGHITSQRMFWDQDQQWFSDMNVIKMPQSSTLSHFLYSRNKLSPILNLSDEHLESGSSNGSDDVNGNNNNNNGYTANGDNDVLYEMNEEMNEILALRGLNISDLQQYEDKTKLKQQSRQKQMAQVAFWIAVGAMFVFIVPKYLGKPKR